jgi:imidazolonepropionase-like amidohydrolase
MIPVTNASIAPIYMPLLPRFVEFHTSHARLGSLRWKGSIMTKRQVWNVSLCVLSICWWLWCAGNASAQERPTVILGGTLIDGNGKEPIPDAVIVIEGDTISRIFPAGTAEYPKNAKVINAKGKFILPGFIDMHVHYDWWMPELFLAHGVTTAVDLASYEWVYAQRDGVAKGKIPGPRIVASSFALDGRLFWNVPFAPLNGVESAREVTRSFIAQGASLIKTYTEISPEELEVVVQEAHQAKLPVMSHLGSIDAAQAARLGVDGLAHASGVALATIADPDRVKELRAFETIGISVDYPRYLLYHAFMDAKKTEELLHLLIQEEVALEPDLVNTSARWAAKRRTEFKQEDRTFLSQPQLRYIPENIRHRMLHDEPAEDLSATEREQLQQGYLNLQSFLRSFVAAGGKLLAGSDTASFVLPGISLHRELELFVEAGLSPMQAIMAATKNNAEFIRQQATLGTLEAGKLADLMIVRRDPLQDIRNTQAIDLVMKGGKVLDTRYHANFRNPIPSPPPPWGYIANPQPTIKMLSPMMGTEGTDITLVIEGENFLANSQVEFNKQKVASIPVHESQVPGTAYFPYYRQLQVTVPARLVTSAGRFPVTVANPQPEGGVSNLSYFIVQFK